MFIKARKTLSAILLSWLFIMVFVPVTIPLVKAATFTVGTVSDVNDSGVCGTILAGDLPGTDGNVSLREAICVANNTAGTDTISFNNAIAGGTITLLSILPAMTEAAIVDGTTLTDVNPAGPDITIVGSSADDYAIFAFDAGSGNVLKGVAVSGPSFTCVLAGGSTGATIGGTGARDGNTMNGCARGIAIEYASNVAIYQNTMGVSAPNTSANISMIGASNVTIGGDNANKRNVLVNSGQWGIAGDCVTLDVKGNYIGTDGAVDLGNIGEGIVITGGSDITIGGTAVGERNVISGNGSAGISIFPTNVTDVTIQGNYVGTNAAGTGAIPNATGISTSSIATIGGTVAGAGNLVSGNTGRGIYLLGTGSSTVQGNIVGLDANGIALPNGVGMHLESGSNLIGGTTASARNVISGNTDYGIRITNEWGVANNNTIEGNYIGVGTSGTGAIANGGIGVELVGGTTGNYVGVSGYGNVISGNGSSGVYLASNGNFVQANYIGLNAAGTGAVANAVGIDIVSNSNTIGGSTATYRNVISGNTSEGIRINGGLGGGDGNIIEGNYIGTNANGNTAIPNGTNGVYIYNSANNNYVGVSGYGNVISGNGQSGVMVGNSGTTANNFVEGNYIGTNASGTGAVSNGVHGVYAASGVTGLTIGGTLEASRNIISGNVSNGIYMGSVSNSIVKNNYVGTNVAGTGSIANGAGMILSDVTNTVVGGNGVENVLSGNTTDGVIIYGTCTGTVIAGNYIGLASNGMTALGNLEKGVASDQAIGVTVGSTTAKNYISGNERGVWLFDTDTVVINNVIGCAIDEVTRVPNAGDGIDIPIGDDQVIGGDGENEGNLFCITSDDQAITVGSALSKYISIRRNSFLPPLVGGYNTILFAAGANENMAVPTVTYADTSYAYGTTCNNCIVDFVGGTNFETTTADASGNWAIHADLSTEGSGYTPPYFIAMNANGSSSQEIEQTPLIDATSPSDLVVTSATGHSTNISAYTFTGTKEAYSSVERDGSGWIAVGGSSTAWTYPITLIEGVNTFNISSLDYSDNRSGTGTYTVTLDTMVPNAPTLLYSSNVATSTASITVTGEVGTSIYVNGIDSGIDIAGGGSSVVSVSVVSGIGNTYLIKLIDVALNESPKVTATIQGGDPVVYGGGESSYSLPDEGADDDEFNDNELAGEKETIEEDYEDILIEEVEEVREVEEVEEVEEVGEVVEVEEVGEVGEVVLEDVPADEVITDIVMEEFEDEESSEVDDVFIDSDIYKEGVDSDNDGMSDYVEAYYGTDPNNADSDEDGFSDTEELFDYGLDPNKADIIDVAELPVKVTNIENDNVLISSRIVFRGVIAPNFKARITIMDENDDDVASVEGEADEKGKFALYLDKDLENGEYKMSVSKIDSTGEVSEISDTVNFYIDNTVESAQVELIANNDSFEFKTEPGTMMFMTWRSLIFSSVFVADMVTGELIVDTPTDLDAGSHVLYAYPIDKETGVIGKTLMVNFSTMENNDLTNISTVSYQDEIVETKISYIWIGVFVLFAMIGGSFFIWKAKEQYKNEKELIDKL